jgi:hypothetical protein
VKRKESGIKRNDKIGKKKERERNYLLKIERKEE